MLLKPGERARRARSPKMNQHIPSVENSTFQALIDSGGCAGHVPQRLMTRLDGSVVGPAQTDLKELLERRSSVKHLSSEEMR